MKGPASNEIQSDSAVSTDADSAGVYLGVSPEDLNYGNLRRASAGGPSAARGLIYSSWRRLKRLLRRKRTTL